MHEGQVNLILWDALWVFLLSNNPFISDQKFFLAGTTFSKKGVPPSEKR